MIKNFVNLTNGIEAIPNINSDYSFIRIQSTTCEQKRWDFLIQDLDNNLLMNLVLGNKCIIYDFGAKKKVPRALYQGVELLKFVLNKRWLNIDIIPYVKSHNCHTYFTEIYRKLDEKTLKKLDYFKKFLCTDNLDLEIWSDATIHDGQIDYYKNILISA